jgi:hypothetical protein
MPIKVPLGMDCPLKPSGSNPEAASHDGSFYVDVSEPLSDQDALPTFLPTTHRARRTPTNDRERKTGEFIRTLASTGERRRMKVAEREGFEPSVPCKGHNGFRDRPDRPLRHLSAEDQNP